MQNGSIQVIRLPEPAYNHREYENDFKQRVEEKKTTGKEKERPVAENCQRVVCVALPFIALYKPLSFPIALVMGGVRTVSCLTQLASTIQQGKKEEIAQALFQTCIAVIALSCTVFAHPLGMVITTAHDILIESYRLIKHLQAGNYQEAMKSCLIIANNALYLALILRGGLELAIASLAIQVFVGIVQSLDDFQKGNHLEAVGHILMGMVRANQLHGHVKSLEFKWKIEESLKRNQKPSKPIENDEAASLPHDDIKNISDKLRGVLTDAELHVLIQMVQNGQPIEPMNLLTQFAAIRGENNAFSSAKIQTIIDTMSTYDQKWKGLEKQESFWRSLREASFGKETLFPNENEHVNYEAKRLVVEINLLKSKTDLISTDMVDAIVKDSLLDREADALRIEEVFWEKAHLIAYEDKKAFEKECWKENFDIAYCTKGFMQEVGRIPQMGDANAALIAAINKFPKTQTIELRGLFYLDSSATQYAVKTSSKYLRNFSVVYCGRDRDSDPDPNYWAVRLNVIEELYKCKELKRVDIMISPDIDPFLIRPKLPEFFREHCPKLEFIRITL